MQIDLLIATKHALYLVDVKRRQRIDREVIDEVQAKAAQLPRDGRSLRTALVYHGVLGQTVADDAYFDVLVPFERLLAGAPGRGLEPLDDRLGEADRRQRRAALGLVVDAH